MPVTIVQFSHKANEQPTLIVVTMPTYKFKRLSHLSFDEVSRMLGKSEPEHEWLRAMIVFLYLYGCRITEALKLSYDNFTIEENYLSVKIGVLKRHSDAGPITPSHVLKVNINSPFMPILINYIKANSQSEKLWHQHRGHVWRKIKQLNPKCSPHFFRHTRLWKLAEKGASEAVLMDWAGWTDPRPAGKYIRATGRLAAQYADQID